MLRFVLRDVLPFAFPVVRFDRWELCGCLNLSLSRDYVEDAPCDSVAGGLSVAVCFSLSLVGFSAGGSWSDGLSSSAGNKLESVLLDGLASHPFAVEEMSFLGVPLETLGDFGGVSSIGEWHS